METQTNLGYWFLWIKAAAGLKDGKGITAHAAAIDGGQYRMTIAVPALREWQAAQLIMHLLNEPRFAPALEVKRDQDNYLITVDWPEYHGDPNAYRES
ncbi:hypothetical protein [Actinacidiphila glaucinigra]|uniref:hypothetical protein n=1 Tax=Actinacidiphila glaucinigra TaxID=235986 RepID=UPI002E3449DF|nr:hypothetical protein [Actinacidiphila glaucinigra]